MKSVINIISEKAQQVIINQLAKSDGMERAIIALNDFGFGSNLATTICKNTNKKR